MRIEITVAGPAGCHDVAVTAARSTTVAAVLPALAGVAGAHACSLWAGSHELPPDTPLGAPGLRTGSIVGVGESGHGPESAALLELQIVGGARSGVAVPLRRGTVTIGRAPDNTVVLADDQASRHHAAFEIGASGIVVRDLGSANGTWLDGVAVPGTGTGVPVRSGQVVRVAETLFAVGAGMRIAIPPPADPDGTVPVHRAPAQARPDQDPVVEMPQHLRGSRPGRVQWITALLPAVLGAGIAVAVDSLQFLLFAVLSPVMVLSGALGDRTHWRRSRRRSAARHRVELEQARDAVTRALADETRRRRRAAPDPPTLLHAAAALTGPLWARRTGDPDHLVVRVGSANRPSLVRTRTGSVTDVAGTVPDVPVLVDLGAGAVGVVGQRVAVLGVVRWLLTQLATLHSPADLRIVLLLESGSDPDWHWARWLPHLGGAVAVGAHACARAVAELRSELDRRRPTAGRERPNAGSTVVVVDGGAAATPGLTALLNIRAEHRITSLCTSDRADALPAPCTRVIRIDDVARGHITAPADGFDDVAIVDRVSASWAEGVARCLAPLVDVGDADNALPSRCRLVDLLAFGPDPVADIVGRWASAGGGAQAVIGTGPDGAVRVDLVRDGPHALVAGTTGAGKSELLRTLLAGLAAGHPPDHLTFLLIDYKGGAAFGECSSFPHTAAMVTDLDPQLTRRALRSLEAEIRRRERLFSDAGVAEFALYRPPRGTCPLARLVIVVDEFATLVDDLPEFVHGVVGVARRGRSLGIHLVLATQRPGSAVSAEIRANTSLRIALRVIDPADSADVLDATDAAYLPPDRPGRAWMRTGSELTCFQTALAGGGTDPATPLVEPLGQWRRPRRARSESSDRSDLGELGRQFSAAARWAGREPARSPWRAPLPTMLGLETLPVSASESVVGVGLVDLPDEQAQAPLTVELDRERSVLIIGRSGSGRTTALSTIVLAAASRIGPAALEIYAVDGSGDLARGVGTLPHIGTCLGPDELDLAATLLDRLSALVVRRERGTVDQPAPYVLLALDSWDRALSALDDLDAARCVDRLGRLARAGSNARVTVIATGDRGLLLPRSGTAGFASRYLLDLADKSDFGVAGIGQRDIPSSLPPGRAVRVSDASVVQFAAVGRRSGNAERREVARGLAAHWGYRVRPAAVRLRPLPVTVRLDSLGRGQAVTLGVAGDLAEACSVDLVGHQARLLVVGPPRSGRSTAMVTVLSEAARTGLLTIVACPRRSPLHQAAVHGRIRVLTPDDTIGSLPDAPALLLVDDGEAFSDTSAGDALASWLRRPDTDLAAVVAGRSDDVGTVFRGVVAEVKRARCGLLLRPGRLDAELVGLPPGTAGLGKPGPPGRGVLVGQPEWGPLFDGGEPVPIQVAESC